MTKNLLKFLATVTVAGLLVGCGSSSSDNDTTGDDNTTTPTTTTPTTGGDDNTTTPTAPTSNIVFADGKFTVDGKELTLNTLSVMDGNTTHIQDTDDSETYALSNLFYEDGYITLLSDSNSIIDTNVEINEVTEEPVINQPIDGDILPSFK